MPNDSSTAIHERFMRAALEEAQRAAENGDTAVAALVTHGDEIVAISGGRVDTTGDPRAHAEMTVIGEACGRLGRARLHECTLYTTMEPCPMCGWAIHLAGIGTLVLGARHQALGRTDLGRYSLEGLLRMTGQSMTIVTGILEAECTAFRRAWQERSGRLV
jgi:tRNA(adenine34) deaminase